MSRPPKIPTDLKDGPFLGSAAIRSRLLTRAQLRSPCWTRLLPDVYCLRSVTLTNSVRLQALRLAAPPGTVITGRTAAWLYGAWSPPPGHRIPLDCTPGPAARRFSCSEVNARRLRMPQDDVVLMPYGDDPEEPGLLVTSKVATCFGLMRRSDLVEAVVWADTFRHQELVTEVELRAYAAQKVRWPNVRTVRLAIDLSHAGAESPMETRLRMILVLAGCPEPYVNRPIVDAEGKFLARPDLSYLDPDLGIEYDGACHLEPGRQAADDVRENKLLVHGMPLLRYGRSAVTGNPQRIVDDVVALRPDFLPLTPLDVPALLVTGYRRTA